eukprot:jgi/Chlat1/8638/Chrsp86S00659
MSGSSPSGSKPLGTPGGGGPGSGAGGGGGQGFSPGHSPSSRPPPEASGGSGDGLVGDGVGVGVVGDRQRVLLELGGTLLLTTCQLDSTVGELRHAASQKAVRRGLPPAAHLALRLGQGGGGGDSGLAILDDGDTLRSLALPRDARVALIYHDVFEAARMLHTGTAMAITPPDTG